MTASPELKRFLVFLATGGAAAAINVAARWALDFVTPFEIAIVLAHLVGMVAAFLLARAFVFQESRSGGAGGQLVRFALVNVVSLSQVWIVSVTLARLVFPAIGWTFEPETLAHMIGVVSTAFTSYVLHKRFSFQHGAVKDGAER